MQTYQREFIEFALERGVLRFGEFVLKSGRQSPYFFNAGLFDSGRALARLGHYYALAIARAGLEFDMLFGPAYKGIPLVVTTAAALVEVAARDVPICFNRKEVKDQVGPVKKTVAAAPLPGIVAVRWCRDPITLMPSAGVRVMALGDSADQGLASEG